MGALSVRLQRVKVDHRPIQGRVKTGPHQRRVRSSSLSEEEEPMPPVQHHRVVAAELSTTFRREPPSAAQGQPPASSTSDEFEFPSLNLNTEAEVIVNEALRDPDIMAVGLSRYSDSPATNSNENFVNEREEGRHQLKMPAGSCSS